MQPISAQITSGTDLSPSASQPPPAQPSIGRDADARKHEYVQAALRRARSGVTTVAPSAEPVADADARAALEVVQAWLRPAGSGPTNSALRYPGRARKVSVSLPEDLTAAVQSRVGRGEFSHYVTEAVARQLELDLLAELAELLEAEHGPVPEQSLAEAGAAWPDAE